MSLDEYIDLNRDLDFLDLKGNLYHIHEYRQAKKLGSATNGIRVTTIKGKFIGYYDPENKKMIEAQ